MANTPVRVDQLQAQSPATVDVLRNLVGTKALRYVEAGADTDITVKWQTALDELEAMGGGIVLMGAGTHTISMANADNAYACLRIPANVTIEGPASAIFTRPAAERTVDGVLLVNKGWDTEGGYGAAGNIVLRGFSITDGDSTGQHDIGDLIAFGHGDGLLVENVHSLNHDQHFLDICGSRNVVVRDCTDDNQTIGTYYGSATVQIDWAHGLGISGLLLDDTPTTDVLVENCNFKNQHCDMVVQLGHNGGTFERIRIVGGKLDGAYASGQNVISIDTNCSIKDCEIAGVELVPNHAAARGLNIVTTSLSATAKALHVHHCKVRGTARVGMYFGINSGYTGTSWPDFTGLDVHDNDVEFTTDPANASGDIYGIGVAGWVGRVHHNSVRLTAADRSKGVYGILVDRNKNLKVEGNQVKLSVTTPATGTAVINPIRIWGQVPDAVGASSIYVARNTLDMGSSEATHGINFNDSTSYPWARTDKVCLSQTIFLGAPITSHIYEAMPASDGTNGRHAVDFGSGVYVKAIASGQFLDGISFGLLKSGNSDAKLSPARIELTYAPNADTGLGTDVEQINFVYLSSTTCAGTQVVDVNQKTGKFGILTGVSGVSTVINNSTFQPVVRTSGYIQAFASI